MSSSSESENSQSTSPDTDHESHHEYEEDNNPRPRLVSTCPVGSNPGSGKRVRGIGRGRGRVIPSDHSSLEHPGTRQLQDSISGFRKGMTATAEADIERRPGRKPEPGGDAVTTTSRPRETPGATVQHFLIQNR